MKKIVCVVLAVLFVFAFVGCSNGGTFSEKNYLSENGQIRSIIIDVADRELNIGLSYDGQISVNYFDSEKQYLESLVGKSYEVLFERERGDSWHQGHTRSYVLVKVKCFTDSLWREMRNVMIISAEDGYCIGEIVDNQEL